MAIKRRTIAVEKQMSWFSENAMAISKNGAFEKYLNISILDRTIFDHDCGNPKA